MPTESKTLTCREDADGKRCGLSNTPDKSRIANALREGFKVVLVLLSSLLSRFGKQVS